MGSVEKVASAENAVLVPGTIQFLEHLAFAEMPEVAPGKLADFLAATPATRGIGLFIKRLRTFRPLNPQYKDLDSRLIKIQDVILPGFLGTIYRNPINPANGHIALIGGSKPQLDEEDYAYSAFIPTHFDLSHDPSRQAQAVFIHQVNGHQQKDIYNEAASPQYSSEHNPNVLVSVLQKAAQDVLVIARHVYDVSDEQAPEHRVLQPDEVRFHPDFLTDDPNQFQKTS